MVERSFISQSSLVVELLPKTFLCGAGIDAVDHRELGSVAWVLVIKFKFA